MKIIKVAAVAFLSMFLLTGCVKLDIALEVNRDSTISGSMIFAISDSLAALGTDASSALPAADTLINSNADGVQVMPYKKDGYTGSTYTFDHVPFSAFKSDGTTSNDIKVTRTGDRIKLTGTLDFSYGETAGSTDPFSNLLAQSFTSAADMKISVKFPVKVLNSTGTISEDGKTVTWVPKLGEKLDLTTVVEIPKGLQRSSLLIYAGVLVALVLSLLLLVSMRKTRKPEADFEI